MIFLNNYNKQGYQQQQLITRTNVNFTLEFRMMCLTIFTFLSQFMIRTSLSDKYPLRYQLFITLFKVRLDLPFEFIALQCGQAQSTVNDVFWRWINLMTAQLRFIVHLPDHETIQRPLPSVFKSKFPKLTSIVDCFEIFIDRPKNLHARFKNLFQL